MKARTFVLVICLVSFSYGQVMETITHDGLDGFVAGEHYLQTDSIPSGPTAPGVAGTIAWDGSYIYICVATDTWKRATLSTWGVSDVLLLDDGVSKLLLDDGSGFLLIRP